MLYCLGCVFWLGSSVWHAGVLALAAWMELKEMCVCVCVLCVCVCCVCVCVCVCVCACVCECMVQVCRRKHRPVGAAHIHTMP